MRPWIVRHIPIMLLWLLFAGCIHEYPRIVPGPAPAPGETPEKVEAFIEVNCRLSWQEMFHTLNFSTRGRSERPHRLIVEVSRDGETVCNDVEDLTEEEFAEGTWHHRLSISLEPKVYTIAVWYDREDADGEHPFVADNLGKVTITSFTTYNPEPVQCGYASDTLDLTEYIGSQETTTILKQLSLSPAGAMVRLVASDVNEFISQNKEALNQGDTFTSRISFSSGAYDSFDSYSGRQRSTGQEMEMSGWMRLPFDEYNSLKIAEGFFFCADEGEATARFSVTNQALMTVSATQQFSFPVKRGYVTEITGDFLTHTVDGVFSINHIWAGEMEYTPEH